MRDFFSISPEHPLGLEELPDVLAACYGTEGADGSAANFLQRRFSLPSMQIAGTLYCVNPDTDFPDPEMPAVCAIGIFDGFHRGHRRVLEHAKAEALRRDTALMVLTFSPNPVYVVGRDKHRDFKILSSDDQRCCCLCACGADLVVNLDFTPDLAAVDCRAFVDEVLCKLADVCCVVVGSNFSFGAGGAGSTDYLRGLGEERGFDVRGIELLDHEGRPVSSTRIREALKVGKVEEAAALLGRAYLVSGKVVHGRGVGHRLGFPTANVGLAPELCLPAEGVYAGFAIDRDKGWLRSAAINVGRPKSFSSESAGGFPALAEAAILGFSGDVYGDCLELLFVRRIRSQERFSDGNELCRAVHQDMAWTGSALGESFLYIAAGGIGPDDDGTKTSSAEGQRRS